jgi:hypothetical protein
MARLSLVLAVLLCVTATAAAGGAGAPAWFELAVSDRLADVPTTVVVAGHQASLIATVYVDYADPGCEIRDFAPHAPLTATVRLPSDVALEAGEATTKTVRMPAPVVAGHADSFNVIWKIVAARPGVYPMRVALSGVTRAGTTCAVSERAEIVAVRGGPQFRVLGAFDDGDRDVVVLSSRLPGLPALGPEARKSALIDAINDEHAPGDAEDGGSIAATMITLRWGGETRYWVGSSGESLLGSAAITCIDFARVGGRAGSGTRLVPYHLLFNWNTYKGFGFVSRHGLLRVGSTVPGAAGRACLREP